MKLNDLIKFSLLFHRLQESCRKFSDIFPHTTFFSLHISILSSICRCMTDIIALIFESELADNRTAYLSQQYLHFISSKQTLGSIDYQITQEKYKNDYITIDIKLQIHSMFYGMYIKRKRLERNNFSFISQLDMLTRFIISSK